jgi:hypothetical protein
MQKLSTHDRLAFMMLQVLGFTCAAVQSACCGTLAFYVCLAISSEQLYIEHMPEG